MVTDVQFDTMGVAVGQVATIRAKLGEEKANLHSEGIVRINIWPNWWQSISTEYKHTQYRTENTYLHFSCVLKHPLYCVTAWYDFSLFISDFINMTGIKKTGSKNWWALCTMHFIEFDLKPIYLHDRMHIWHASDKNGRRTPKPWYWYLVSTSIFFRTLNNGLVRVKCSRPWPA